MSAGAVYLCSVLHFAPAEPPTIFIRWLLVLTNALPVCINIIYIGVRTALESSPLNLLIKLPYYHFTGDRRTVDLLWQTELDCWMNSARHEFIEEIPDLPNLVLTILNGGLFVMTLIIMCRMGRPGSTRPEMSLLNYVKAAGTLTFLYGAHYTLFVYLPEGKSCFSGQLLYYAFLFVDGIQGIAVSYVFCYRTHDGRKIIRKWLRITSFDRHHPQPTLDQFQETSLGLAP